MELKVRADLRLLVTRPIAQTQQLVALLTAVGIEPIVLPMIQIVPIPPKQWPPVDLEQFDAVVFVSANAVRTWAATAQRLPQHIRTVAVGAATAQAMRDCAIAVSIAPDDSLGSESLLQLRALQDVAGEHWLIIRGQGGRAHLAASLTQRGATVAYLEVYRRECPHYSAAVLADAQRADVVLATSLQSLAHLQQVFVDSLHWLYTKPLLALSQRIADHALSCGFQHCYVTADATDAAIVSRLRQMECCYE